MTIRLPGSTRGQYPSYCYLLRTVRRARRGWTWDGAVHPAGATAESVSGALCVEACGPIRPARGHLSHTTPHRWALHELQHSEWREIASCEACASEWRDELLPLAAAILRQRRRPPPPAEAIEQAAATIRRLAGDLDPLAEKNFLAGVWEWLSAEWAGAVCLSVSETRHTDLPLRREHKHYRVRELSQGRGCGGRGKIPKHASGKMPEVYFRELLHTTESETGIRTEPTKKGLRTVTQPDKTKLVPTSRTSLAVLGL